MPALAHRLTGTVGEYDRLMGVLQKISPYPIAFEPILRESVNGYCDYEAQRIVIRAGVSQEQAVKTTVHEMAHALLHSSKAGPERDRQAFEVQAESVAYVVCQHFGIDSSQYSFGYVAGWSGSVQLEVLEQSLTVIQNGALQIIDSTEFELIARDREINALRQLWEIETNDPATQEWRSLLHPDEQMLVNKWDNLYSFAAELENFFAKHDPCFGGWKSQEHAIQTFAGMLENRDTGWFMDTLNELTAEKPWLKAQANQMRQKVQKYSAVTQPPRSIPDKLTDAKVEADRMNTQRHAGHTAKRHDMVR